MPVAIAAATLSTDVAWTLTQPQATLGAAGIAVVAATIAFIGVLMNVRATNRQHREKLDEEDRERRRKEVVDVLSDALAELETAMRDVYDYVDIGPEYDEVEVIKGFIDSRIEPVNLRIARFDLLGLSGPSSALELVKNAILGELYSANHGGKLDTDRLEMSRKETIAAFRAEKEKHDRRPTAIRAGLCKRPPKEA